MYIDISEDEFVRSIPTCSSTPVGAYFTWDNISSADSVKKQRINEREYTPISSSARPARFLLKNRFDIL